jgi:PTH1 family peptidyl-tRNA hydrolase
VGLGNPGARFKNTYHNVGMLAVEYIAEELEEGGATIAWKTHKNLFNYALAADTALVIPLTFMNESGVAVKEALKRLSGAEHDLILIHDESDLTVGTYRISSGRNAAGHNGVQSTMDVLGTKNFTRVRIGIRGKNEVKRKKASEFVLKKIKPQDLALFLGVFKRISAEAYIGNSLRTKPKLHSSECRSRED